MDVEHLLLFYSTTLINCFNTTVDLYIFTNFVSLIFGIVKKVEKIKETDQSIGIYILNEILIKGYNRVTVQKKTQPL